MTAYLMPLLPWLVAAGLLAYFGILALITELVLRLLRLKPVSRPDYRRWMRAKALWTPYHWNGSSAPTRGRAGRR